MISDDWWPEAVEPAGCIWEQAGRSTWGNRKPFQSDRPPSLHEHPWTTPRHHRQVMFQIIIWWRLSPTRLCFIVAVDVKSVLS